LSDISKWAVTREPRTAPESQILCTDRSTGVSLVKFVSNDYSSPNIDPKQPS